VGREAGYGYEQAIKIRKPMLNAMSTSLRSVLSSKFWVGRSVTAAGILADGRP
jgi:hypothetical protein